MVDLSACDLSGISILVVDDEPVSSMFIGKILAKYGASVAVAYAGAEALELFARSRFDIVVTDICMPGMDGLELAANLRQLNEKTQVIAATAVYDTDTLLRAIKLGFNDYITKPVEVETLLWAIKRSRDVVLAERLLVEEQIKFKTVVDTLGEGLAIKDPDCRIIYQNKALADKFGDMVGKPCYTIWGLDAPCKDCSAALIMVDGLTRSDVRTYEVNDKPLIIETTASALRNSAGEITGTVEIIRDVSARVRSEQLVRNIARGVSSKLGAEYLSSLTCYLTEALEMDFAMVGELLGDSQIQTVAFSRKGKLCHGFSYDLHGTPCAQALANGLQIYPDNVMELFPDDVELKSMAIRSYCGAPLFDSRGEAVGILCTFHTAPLSNTELVSDIIRIFASRVASEMERIKYEQTFREMALHDHLTGLANRRLFEDRLAQSLAKGRRDGSRFALIYLDLDFFKTVNDSYGHEVGDTVLKSAAERIKHCCRRDRDTISRHGGDEFCIIIEDVEHEEALAELAKALNTAISEPLLCNGQQIVISASLGIAVYPGDGDTIMELEMAADRAMYAAKQGGRNTFRFIGELQSAP